MLGPSVKSAAVCGPLTGELGFTRGKGTGSTRLRWWRRGSEYAVQPAGKKLVALSRCSLQSTVALRSLPALTALAVSLCTANTMVRRDCRHAGRSRVQYKNFTKRALIHHIWKRGACLPEADAAPDQWRVLLSCSAACQGGLPRLCQGGLSMSLDLAPPSLEAACAR